MVSKAHRQISPATEVVGLVDVVKKLLVVVIILLLIGVCIPSTAASISQVSQKEISENQATG